MCLEFVSVCVSRVRAALRRTGDVTCTSKMTLLRAIIYIISVLSFACPPIDFMSVASHICVQLNRITGYTTELFCNGGIA